MSNEQGLIYAAFTLCVLLPTPYFTMLQTETLRSKSVLDKPFLANITLNWELILYVSLFVLAVATRFYDLGSRVMSHDESLHTLYSWNLYAGKGYVHDPLMHGPFLFHITALMYFLFGDNDYTARMGTALFGVLVVMSPYLFRPWLGRTGALATSFMLLISPGILYYSRYIRHDIFLIAGVIGMTLGFFHYMRTRQPRWMYLAALSVAFMLTTKEASYIHGFLGVTFIALTVMWEQLSRKYSRLFEYGFLGSIIITGGLAIFLANQAPPPAEAAEGLNIAEYAAEFVAVMCMLIAALLTKYTSDPVNQPVSKTIFDIPKQIPELGKAAIGALVLFTVFHTTFFSNINGLYTGTLGEILYWLDQHGVHRGGQPWYYYILLMPLYEFLPLLLVLGGGVVYLVSQREVKSDADLEYEAYQQTRTDEDEATQPSLYPSDGGTFCGYILYWMIGSWTIYSWAGEKMPWLSVHITIPTIFMAGYIIQNRMTNINWVSAWRNGGVRLAIAVALIIPAAVVLLTETPFQSQSLQAAESTATFLFALAVLVAVGFIIWQGVVQFGPKLTLKLSIATLLAMTALFTIRASWIFNYINYDYVNEPLVYAHGSPDVKLVLNQIDEISRRTVGDKMIQVAYDNDSTWPLEWYMREYPNRVYYGENPTRDALDVPIVIVGAANESKVKPYLGNEYTRYEYRLVWWPVEDYKTYHENLGQLGEDFIYGEEAAKNRESLARIWFYRDYVSYDLNQWPFVHRFYLYISNETLRSIPDYFPGPNQFAPAVQIDPFEGKRTEIEALNKIGNGVGSADGQLNAPRNVAVAPDGNIYVADSGNHRIQVFDRQGNSLFNWGTMGEQPSQFNEPWGIVIDSTGQVYVADTWNHRIQVFGPDGSFIKSFGTFTNAQSDPNFERENFWGPRGLTVDAEDNLYVTDTGNKRIQKFAPDGSLIGSWGGGGIIPGTFEEPVGIAIDGVGNIYVADAWNQRIQKFDANFTPLAQWEFFGWESENIFNKPYLAVDDNNRLYVSDPESYRVVVYDTESGEIHRTWGQYGDDLSSFALPTGLAVDQDGTLLVIDADNNRILRFDVSVF